MFRKITKHTTTHTVVISPVCFHNGANENIETVWPTDFLPTVIRTETVTGHPTTECVPKAGGITGDTKRPSKVTGFGNGVFKPPVFRLFVK
jgi:hypothetical protein